MRFKWLLGLIAPLAVWAQEAPKPKPMCERTQVLCAYPKPDTTLQPITLGVRGLHLYAARFDSGYVAFAKGSPKGTRWYTPADRKLDSLIRASAIIPHFDADPMDYKHVADYAKAHYGASQASVAESGKEESSMVKKLYAEEAPKAKTEPKKPAKTVALAGEVARQNTSAKKDTEFIVVPAKAPSVDSAALIERGKREKAKEVAAKIDSLVDKARRDSLRAEAVKKEASETFSRAQAKESLANAKLDSAKSLAQASQAALQDTTKARNQRKIPISKETPKPRPAVAQKRVVDTVRVPSKPDTVIVPRVDTVQKLVPTYVPVQTTPVPAPAPVERHHKSCWTRFSGCTVGTALVAAAAGYAIAKNSGVKAESSSCVSIGTTACSASKKGMTLGVRFAIP